jgi:hypothetical protein
VLMLVLRLKTSASSSALFLISTLCRQMVCLASRHPRLAAVDPQQSHSLHHQGAAVIIRTAQGVHFIQSQSWAGSLSSNTAAPATATWRARQQTANRKPCLLSGWLVPK